MLLAEESIQSQRKMNEAESHYRKESLFSHARDLSAESSLQNPTERDTVLLEEKAMKSTQESI